jgi:hypothetical protein
MRNMEGARESECDLVNIIIADSLVGTVSRPWAQQPRDRSSIPACS